MLDYLIRAKQSPRKKNEFDKKTVKEFIEAGHTDLISDLMLQIGFSNLVYINDLVASNTACSICQEQFSASDAFVPFPGCKHCFHSACFKPHLKTNKLCPLCRRQITESIIEELDKQPANETIEQQSNDMQF